MGIGLKQLKAEKEAALQEKLTARIAAVAAAMPKETKDLPPQAPLEVKHSSHILAEYIHSQWSGALNYEDCLLLVQQVFQGVADYLFHTGSILLPNIGTVKIVPRVARVFRTFDGLTRQKDAYQTLTISSARSVRRILDNSKTRIVNPDGSPVVEAEETDSLLDDVVTPSLEMETKDSPEEEVLTPATKKAPKAPIAKRVEAPVAKKAEAPKAPAPKKTEAPVAKKAEVPKAPAPKKTEAPVAKKVEAPAPKKTEAPVAKKVETPKAPATKKGGVMTPTTTTKKGGPASKGTVLPPEEKALPKGGQVSPAPQPKSSSTKKKKKKLRGVLPPSKGGAVFSRTGYGGKLIE